MKIIEDRITKDFSNINMETVENFKECFILSALYKNTYNIKLFWEQIADENAVSNELYFITIQRSYKFLDLLKLNFEYFLII